MSRWRRTRGWVLVVLAVVFALAVAVWTTRDAESHPDPLDPRNPGPEGAQALAEVLAGEGVDVTVVRSADALEEEAVDASSTVVVTGTDSLSPGTLDRLRTHVGPGLLILVEPSYAVLQEIDDDIDATSEDADEVRASCTGSDDLGLDDLRLEVDSATGFDDVGASSCFPTGDGTALLVGTASPRVLLFGAGQALSNDQVLRADNAAVALRLLGRGDDLVWYVPDLADATSDEAVTLSTLLPRWLGPGIWLGGLAVIALVAWRFRRLGPLSTEPLPVVVRAVETAHSRARLYRRSGDRDHAARALRRAARADLAVRLRLDRQAPPAAVCEATARHLGTPVADVDALLGDHQAPPATDHDLIQLAQALTRLRREVRG